MHRCLCRSRTGGGSRVRVS
uniref:Uncharacterized protein n=1 Tax=Rhizophora mucronata TaxID=61149 RepID=A0A2P2JU68_RHIMU